MFQICNFSHFQFSFVLAQNIKIEIDEFHAPKQNIKGANRANVENYIQRNDSRVQTSLGCKMVHNGSKCLQKTQSRVQPFGCKMVQPRLGCKKGS